MHQFHTAIFSWPFLTAIFFTALWLIEWKKLPAAAKRFFPTVVCCTVTGCSLLLHTFVIGKPLAHYYLVDVVGDTLILFTFPAITFYYSTLSSRKTKLCKCNNVILIVAGIFAVINLIFGFIAAPTDINLFLDDAHNQDDTLLHYNIAEFIMVDNKDVINISFLILSSITLYSLIRSVYKYKTIMESYFADEQMHDLKKIQRMSILLILLLGYFWCLILIDKSLIVKYVFIASILGIVGSILLFIVFYYAKNINKSVREIRTPTIQYHIANITSTSIEDIIKQWAEDPVKPYLRAGISLYDVSTETGTDRNLISKYLNSILKLNFNEWINGLRIDEAKRMLLSDRNRSILDIAIACGYSDQSVFSRAFHRFAGTTPSAFRASNKE